MGHCEKFEERQLGNERWNLFTGCPSAKTATIVLRGGSEQARRFGSVIFPTFWSCCHPLPPSFSGQEEQRLGIMTLRNVPPGDLPCTLVSSATVVQALGVGTWWTIHDDSHCHMLRRPGTGEKGAWAVSSFESKVVSCTGTETRR